MTGLEPAPSSELINSCHPDQGIGFSCARVSEYYRPTTHERGYIPPLTFDRKFFITTVTWQRTPLFRNPQIAELMMDVLNHYGEQEKYDLHEFVITPDHLRLLFSPAAEISLERAIQLIKDRFPHQLFLGGPRLYCLL